MSLWLLVRRHLRTAVGATAALAVVALGTAALVSAVPRATAALHADELAHAVAQASAISSDVVATSTTYPGYGGAHQAYGGTDLGAGDADGSGTVTPPQPDLDGYLTALTALAAAQPSPLADVLGTPDLVVSSDRLEVERVEGNDVASPGVVLRAGPRLRDQVDVVAGRWPRPTPVPVDRTTLLPGPDGVVEVVPDPVEVAASTGVADELDWELGSVHPTGDPLQPALRVVALWEPRDARADVWSHVPRTTGPEIVVDPNIGKIVTAGVLTDPGALGAWTDAPTARIWYPVDASGLTAADAPALLAQLRGLTATTSTVVEGDPAVLEPASGLVDLLAEALGRRQGVDAIVAVLAVGPLGALAAVLVLAARLVVERRRATVVLVRARGAGDAWIRTMLALEGLAVGLPAATAGLLLGLAAVPGPVTAGQVGAAAACGLAPAAGLAAVVHARSARGERADLGTTVPRRRRSRAAVEAGVLLAAAATTWLAIDRGRVTGPDGTGVDPLLVAAPLLVGLSVAFVVLRLVPPAVRLGERALARRRDLVPFLGAARVRRAVAGGPVPAVALVLACGVAFSSITLASTVRAGIEQQAWTAVGADLRLAGPVVDADVTAAIAAVDGVTAVAPVADAGRYPLGTVGSGTPVTAYTTDAAALAAVQSGAPGAPDGVDLLTEVSDGRLPALATGDVATGTPVLTGPGGAAVPVTVVGHVDRLPGLPPSSGALVVDAGLAAELAGIDGGVPRLALIGLADDLGPAGHADAVAGVAAAAPTGVVDDPLDGRAALLASPAASGLATAFVAAVVLSVLLCVATVGLMLVLAAPARRRLLAVLRALGLPRRAERGIVAWEVGPWVVAALVAGAVLGGAVAALVLAVVDLTPLTGGGAAPRLQVAPWWSAAFVVGLLGATAAGVAVAGRRRRGSPAVDLGSAS
ncbi:hypothetical protein GCM10023216_24910 [Isoptericola chiayiensis]|uniref:ABC3 transporter permease C-terminal domain-containing protein n=1 Tax=Isoptericola chiayiensis TaxID=579446 RepID=A0ABP8YMV6_9MICO